MVSAQVDMFGYGTLTSSPRLITLSRRADLEIVDRFARCDEDADDGKPSPPEASGVSQDSSSSLSLELMAIFSTVFFVASLGCCEETEMVGEKKKGLTKLKKTQNNQSI